MGKVLKAVLFIVLALHFVISGSILGAETPTSTASEVSSEATTTTAVQFDSDQASIETSQAATESVTASLETTLDPLITLSSEPSSSTHTYTGTRDISIKVYWEDMNNMNGKRPHELKAVLNNGMEVTLNDQNDWSATLTGLPAYEDREAIPYQWSLELLPEEYSQTSTFLSEAGGVTAITLSYVQETNEMTVKIQWMDDNNKQGRRPQEINLTLSNGMAVTLNARNSWTVAIIQVPSAADGRLMEYTWSEEDVPWGYILSSITRMGTITTYHLELEQYKAQLLATDVLNEIGYDLKTAYQWSVNMDYEEAYTGNTVFTSAIYGFEKNKGDCFAKACTFCVMARILGYDCKVIYGLVPYARGGYGDHAWCEIVYNGELMVCDPDFESDTGNDGYMICYGQEGTWRYVYEQIVKD